MICVTSFPTDTTEKIRVLTTVLLFLVTHSGQIPFFSGVSDRKNDFTVVKIRLTHIKNSYLFICSKKICWGLILRALTIVKKSLFFDDKTFAFCSWTYSSKENIIKSYFRQFPYEFNGKKWKVDVKTTLIKR